MAISASGLASKINSEINNRKVDTTTVQSFDKDGKPTSATKKQLPNDEGVALVEAIATAVVDYLKANLEIDSDAFKVEKSSNVVK